MALVLVVTLWAGTAGATCTTVDASPREPYPLSPQHVTFPPVFTAHMWSEPDPIPLTPLVSPVTCVGVRRSVVVPSPTWP